MATDGMTAKITPNDQSNTMTSTKHGRFSDQEIAQAATPTKSTESSAPEDPAFERHYRIGELAETWQLGRETVRLLVKGSLRARTELQSRVEPVGIGRRELVDHHVTAAVTVCRQLFCERPILAERRGGDLRARAIGEEDLGGVRDRDAGRSGGRVRCWHSGCGLTAPTAKRFDGCRVGAGFVPGRRAGAFAAKASGQCAGDENDARTSFPAPGTLGEFT